jgi:uncharacterized membrane protein
MKNEKIDTLKKHETDLMQKLNQIVLEAIKNEELITENLLHPAKEVTSFGQRISDKVAQFGGSWKFIILFSIILFAWIVFNSIALGVYKFDPYPFILMNLILSTIAALQAPIIMMSQNRQEEKDRQRGENDYLINMKAELEIRSLHQKIDLLLEEQIKTLFDSQAEQLKELKKIQESIKILKK